METLDQRLRREMQQLSPPGDPAGIVDHVLRNAARRHARRSAGIALLALSVIAGSIVGFYALSRVFGGADPPISSSAPATNGPITMSLQSESTTQRIALLDPDGTGLRFLTAGDWIATLPAWSPDGSQLVFWRAGPDETQGLWIMDADGTHARPLYETAASIWAIEWSPDGSKIAFVNIDLPQGPATELDLSNDLYTVDADGTHATPLVTEGQVTDFDWSPDGTQLVIERQYAPDEDRLGFDLAIVDANGGREQPLTSDGVSRDPTWSPDGSSIVHVGSATGEFRESDLFAIAPDGTGRVQLTDDNAPEEDPVFSPDGALVAFTRFAHGDGSACELMLMEPDGSAARVIATKDTLGGCPVSLSWQPILEGEDEVSPIPTPTPSPTDESLPSGERDHAVSLEGVPFLVCDIDAFTWRYSTEGIGQAFTFEQAMGDVCDARVEGPQYLGVTTEGGEGISRADAYFGPLTRCVEPTGCWIYASVELIDGDREDEILVGTNGFPGGIEVWFFDVTSVDGRYEVMPFESECPANADCDPMMIHRIDWELPGLNGASCGRYALHGSYSYSAGEFFEWTSDTGDGWTADRWEFRDGQAAVDNLREVVSHGDPRNEFAPSDDSQICLAPAAVAPSVLDG